MELGIEIIPDMPVDEVVETARRAEALGYTTCLVADEGFMHDVYVLLGAIAQHSSRLRLGPVTNGYTRHPAVTAVAMASLSQMTGGRAVLTLVAGGSYVLRPMGLERQAPLTVVRESVELMRRLWRGERVSWQGRRFQLDEAQLAAGSSDGPLDIPIWIAGRGPKMLQLSGAVADGVLLMVKSDLGQAVALVEEGREDRQTRPQRIYLDRFAYTPELLAATASFFPHVIADSPTRQLRGFLQEEEIKQIRHAIETRGYDAAAELITPQMIQGYKIAGTPQECSEQLAALVEEHELDTFILNIVSAGLEKNTKLMEDVLAIVDDAGIAVDGPQSPGQG
ncbi:MAG: LLM class flavin-dependent oxidoreductase [Chloroflexota bacterium]